MTDSPSSPPPRQHTGSVQDKKRDALTQLQAGKLDAAKLLCLEACRLDPGDTGVWVMLGNVAMQSGNPAQAEAAYREALRLDPGLGEAHQYLGNLLCLLGRNDEAVASYRQALRAKPHSIPAHINLANTLVIQGRFEEAEDAYRSALHYEPGNRKAALGMAHAYERQGKTREAFAHLQPYLDPEKVDADAAMIFAALCRPLQRCDEAIALMERLLARRHSPLNDQERSTLYFRLGNLHDANDEYDAAFHSYKCGNDLKAREWRFDAQAHIRHIDALITTFNKAFVDSAPRAAPASQPIATGWRSVISTG
ncbi:MAG: tetratricopeptide repeat protein [Gammaproteobacteria bacterium]